ncbi:MAG: hypothetical protein IIY32_03220 [Thermoguttaceae bacterium]|nr:hypothetical protein [Thermoguttaceae bacterium]
MIEDKPGTRAVGLPSSAISTAAGDPTLTRRVNVDVSLPSAIDTTASNHPDDA